jgi:CHAD domain-containing protein
MRQNKPVKATNNASEPPPPAPPSDLVAYATQVIATRLERMLSYREGVQRAEEIEPVHQMRVWSRRTRAALEVFRACFPGKEYIQLEREVKAVTDSLSEARDLDVMMETLHKRAERLPPEQRQGIESFIERLGKQRAKSQKPVLKALQHLEHGNLAQRFEALAAVSVRAHHAPAEADHQEKSAHG